MHCQRAHHAYRLPRNRSRGSCSLVSFSNMGERQHAAAHRIVHALDGPRASLVRFPVAVENVSHSNQFSGRVFQLLIESRPK
jgi:hypothetical protein